MPSDDDKSTAPVDDGSAAEAAAGSSLGWRIAAIVLVILATVAVVVLGALLFLSDGAGTVGADVRACILDPASRDFTKDGKEKGHAKPANCPPDGAEKADGLVEKTTDGGFTMRTIDGGSLGETITLHVRTPDRPYIDIAHAQTHAALGQPIRVYTLEVDGKRSVVYMEDAPLLGR